jgi:NosR/NirI family nitrous oxide reductase transcriptional regulator
VLLVAVTVVYAYREKLTRLSTHKNKWPVNAFKYTAWALEHRVRRLWPAMAQPSITQVLTWFHFAAVPVDLVAVPVRPVHLPVLDLHHRHGVPVRARAVLRLDVPVRLAAEAIYKIARKVGLKRFQTQLPQKWHDRLKWLKYASSSACSRCRCSPWAWPKSSPRSSLSRPPSWWASMNRAWPYGLFVAAILGLSIFIERPYCKYICPLGASLAMPSTFRWFGLKRKQDCNSCKACAVGCGAQAIDADGRIDHRECLHCLDCMILYTDTKGCPPLAKERKRREKDGLEITPIGANGYFIPIHPATSFTEQISAKAAQGTRPAHAHRTHAARTQERRARPAVAVAGTARPPVALER